MMMTSSPTDNTTQNSLPSSIISSMSAVGRSIRIRADKMSSEVLVKNLELWTYKLEPKMSQSGGFSVLPITEADKTRVLDFLRRFFFRDEPLVDHLKLVESPDSRCEELEEYSVESIQEGTSFMAVNREGMMVGVCLNGLLTRDQHSLEPPESEQLLELEACQDLKFRKILKLLKMVYWETNAFKRYPDVHSVLEVKIISVDASCRGQGIAKALVHRTIDLARERNIPLLRVDCTSAFSTRVVERLGFRRVLCLPYADHTDPEGKPVFVPAPPHTAVNSLVYTVARRESAHC